jgi:hypothetical protein
MPHPEQLTGQLSELWNQLVHTEVIEERLKPGAHLTVCQMSYHSDSNSGRIRQTVLVLDADSFDLPQFCLQPENRIREFLTGLMGFEDIDFVDDPAFSDTYFLNGGAVEPVRVLFTQTMRDWFASHPGWSVYGKGRLLAIFRFRKRCSPNDIDRFIDDCMPMLPLFRDGERELDARPDLSRHATAQDFADRVSGMAGLIGRILQPQLAKLRVTTAELDQFVKHPVPRSIPPGLKRQVLGDNTALILVGGVFILAGVGAGLLTFLMPDKGVKAIGLLFLFLFPLIGGLMSGLTIRHRTRKSRLLREGMLCRGRIKDVSRTSTAVNNQIRFHVRIRYRVDGRKCTTQCNAYGPMVDLARTRQETGEPVRVLVDPRDADHIVCLELLSIVE